MCSTRSCFQENFNANNMANRSMWFFCSHKVMSNAKSSVTTEMFYIYTKTNKYNNFQIKDYKYLAYFKGDKKKLFFFS